MKKIPLTQGQYALVDDENYDELNKHKWCAMYSKSINSFYAARNISNGRNKQKTVFMHRCILKVMNNDCIDHINHNTLDNRKLNIRDVTKSQNAMNAGVQKNNKSGHKGVYFDKANGKWRATISINYKKLHIGYYTSLIEAINARKKAEEYHFGVHAYKQ